MIEQRIETIGKECCIGKIYGYLEGIGRKNKKMIVYNMLQ